MPESLSPITPAQRQRLQKLWEEARGLIARAASPLGRKEAEKIHELLAECVAGDPGNTIYLDALLLNLRQLPPKPRFGFQALFSASSSAYAKFMKVFPLEGPIKALSLGPAAIREIDIGPRRDPIMYALSEACQQLDLPQAEIRYLQEAIHYCGNASDKILPVLLFRSLMRQGRFDEARAVIKPLRGDSTLATERGLLIVLDGIDEEHRNPKSGAIEGVAQNPNDPNLLVELAKKLIRLGKFDEAEAAAAKALSLSGGDLAIREQVEEISLAHLRNNVAIARRLVEHEPSEPHQQTLRRWEEELGRLELATLNARSERFPQDAGLKLEVAVRLRRAGNYSGAIQRLDEIAADSSLRPSVLIELGECWQHLRQFEKALGYYSQAVSAADTTSQSDPLHLALYRAGTLAAAMQRISEARATLERLVSLAPDHKDVQERLRALR